MEQILEQLKQHQHEDSTKATYYRVWRKFNQIYHQIRRHPKTVGTQSQALLCTHDNGQRTTECNREILHIWNKEHIDKRWIQLG